MGGIFGAVGTAFGRVVGIWERKITHKHEIAEWAHETQRWEHESKILELQMKARAEETEQQILLTDTTGGWAGLEASIAADSNITGVAGWVNSVRALVRPALTVLLWLITFGIFFSVDENGRYSILNAAVFAATSATLWWFGDRANMRNQFAARAVDRHYQPTKETEA